MLECTFCVVEAEVVYQILKIVGYPQQAKNADKVVGVVGLDLKSSGLFSPHEAQVKNGQCSREESQHPDQLILNGMRSATRTRPKWL